MKNKISIIIINIIILTILIFLFFGIKDFINTKRLNKELLVKIEDNITIKKDRDILKIEIDLMNNKNDSLLINEKNLIDKINQMETSISDYKGTIKIYKKSLYDLELKLNTQKEKVTNFDFDYKNTNDELINKIKKNN